MFMQYINPIIYLIGPKHFPDTLVEQSYRRFLKSEILELIDNVPQLVGSYKVALQQILV